MITTILPDHLSYGSDDLFDADARGRKASPCGFAFKRASNELLWVGNSAAAQIAALDLNCRILELKWRVEKRSAGLMVQEPPFSMHSAAVDPKVYDAYLGSYEVSSVAIHIIREGDHLFAEINGNKNEIFPESLREYFFKAFDAQIIFVTDSKDRATELILHEGGTAAKRHELMSRSEEGRKERR